MAKVSGSVPSVKSKGKKLPKPAPAEMGDVKEAPKTKKKAMPSVTAPAGVSQGDGDGQKMEVSAEVAKAAPKSKGEKKAQGESQEMKKCDEDGRYC